MTSGLLRTWVCATAGLLACGLVAPGRAGELIVELGKAEGVTFVGAFNRWDADGNPRTPVNPKARIDAPEVTAKAEQTGSDHWVFRDLPAGRYDLVILAGGNVRVEGFHYPPITEFDPILLPSAFAPDDARDWIIADIAKSKHYENKVTPLFLAGTDKQVRIVVQLLRDQPTSFDQDFGAPVATLRHEIWQYNNRYGGWVKDKKSKVIDRILMAKSELYQWTWIWEPRLGGIEVTERPVHVRLELPGELHLKTARGLLPAGATLGEK